MDNGSTNLALNVIPDHWQVSLFEAILPVFFTTDKDRNAIDKAHSCFQELLYVPLGGGLRAHGQVVDDNISSCILKDMYDISSLTGGFCNHAGEVLAKPIMGHTAIDRGTYTRNISKAICVIGSGIDSFAQVFSYFILINIKSRRKLDIADVVTCHINMHQSRNEV